MFASQKAEACEEDPLLKKSGVRNATDLPSTGRLLAMTVFTFPMSVIWATMGMVVLPAEALRLFPTNEAFFLGLMMTAVAVAQLICPLAGLASDRCRSRWGKRRPFILLGTAVSLVSILGLWFSSQLKLGVSFFACLFVSQVALNVIYSAQASIVPDNFKEDKGRVSGIVSSLQLAGNLTGMTWIILTWQHDYHLTYGTHVVLLMVAAVIVCQIPEKSTDQEPSSPLTWQDIKKSFTIDLDGDRDFFYVFVGRMFFYVSMSCTTFIYYYLRDLMLVSNEEVVRFRLAVLCLISTVIGLCASFPMGMASDNPKVGRKALIYFACSLMASVYIGYCLVPHTIGPGLKGMIAIYMLGGVYGLGFAGYLSVDYALALDCLPEKHKGSSEALGLWGIAGFAGSMLGPLLGSGILEFHDVPGGGYTQRGYVLMLSMGVGFFVLSSLVTSLIKQAN
mmetsp:Transcript_1028/g.1806  ORF Transcript_1028/g.1806 Transcript_1028/m.1806 type:complete len:449 (+) Transcript_1028:102-1448(+)